MPIEKDDRTKDYDRIAKAIAFMRENHLRQPDLATIAEHLHLSEYHFQRLFTRWAGISPKRFLQYLTVEYAKSRIAETKNLLDLSVDVGLSSSSRLHDLFVNLEAMSPGEFKSGGAGLQIFYGIHDTLFGRCAIATTTRGICTLQFLDVADLDLATQNIESLLRLEWPQAEILYDPKATQFACDRIFCPTLCKNDAPENEPLKLFVKGTNFQIQVWRALLNIPFGAIATYQNLAEAIGRPTAARAIGNAVGSNPIAYIIPCHRVLRASGELGGYRWGCDRKMSILGWEASQIADKSQIL
ncbi:methylated-DNA--[protein]-cysteine S-methyltransferase [Tumidithrix elongata RA019]|uniref:methylated-DNA--[protein]-cysteine S-methyltransferase n=2 Tax=Tumidithrix TaxID=3088355 RepID=A0AAW9PQE7_9CYAN|nr:methylated-DNA--[protein]-cysteine S-methyltransferase [Tumidithrix elongata RA019]